MPVGLELHEQGENGRMCGQRTRGSVMWGLQGVDNGKKHESDFRAKVSI